MPQPAHPYAVNGLTLAQAEHIATAALAKGRALNLLPLAVVVLDAGGHLKSAKREDGASLLRPEIATAKAFGCLGMGFGGREFARRVQAAPGFIGAQSDVSQGRIIPAQGGVLVRDAHQRLLGAVGVSRDVSAQDEACCVAGIEAAGLLADTGDPA